MSVVINSNAAARMAATNLAESSLQLQKSLNRLSSGSRIVDPEDDAGGLAVSMKLSATARRQSAVTSNLGNATSFLQTQDGVLGTVGKVLTRIGELKTLYADPTKNASDRGNYNAEFKQLQTQLTSLSQASFNGISLFGSSGLSVGLTAESNGSTASIGAVDLMGGTGTTLFSDDFSDIDLSNWFNSSAGAAGNVLTVAGQPGVDTLQTFSGALDVTFNVQLPAASAQIALYFNGTLASQLVAGTDLTDTASHTVKVSLDGAGNAKTYLDGSATAEQTQTGVSTGTGTLGLGDADTNPAQVTSFNVSTGTGTPTNIANVAGATDLGSTNLSTMTSALQEVATFRANNGASQSRLGFATDVLTTNRANIQAANSRIADVDVAEESTRLARYNVLTQAGSAMLAQANQSTQAALKLLG